jgi:hypothetical protein
VTLHCIQCTLFLEEFVTKKKLKFDVRKNMERERQEQPEAKMGRPPVSEDLRRTWRVAVTVNRGELDIISAAAAADKQTVSDWSRQVLLKAAEKGAK